MAVPGGRQAHGRRSVCFTGTYFQFARLGVLKMDSDDGRSIMYVQCHGTSDFKMAEGTI